MEANVLRILIDTCVWQHWFTFKREPETLSQKHRAYSENFDIIYRKANSSNAIELLYNALVVHELGIRYSAEFSEYVLPIAKKIVIPLTRCDGLYIHDGSILHGGLMGGSLKDFLTADGYPQEEKIQEEAKKLQAGAKLYKTNPRKRELDVEHMESALEAKADLFITNDEKTIIKRLEKMSARYDSGHPINLIYSITKTPTTALPDITRYLKS